MRKEFQTQIFLPINELSKFLMLVHDLCILYGFLSFSVRFKTLIESLCSVCYDRAFFTMIDG
jgi:hypothetical protein